MEIINDAWVIRIGTTLISALIIALLTAIVKRDLPDKQVGSNDWPIKNLSLSSNAYGWAGLDKYLGKGLNPVYFYPYKYWFRQKVCYKDMILVKRA
jgi:hypothetical protein